MVLEVEDILEELGPLYSLQQDAFDKVSLGRDRPSETSWLLNLVGFELTSLDELVRLSARPVAQVLGELFALELIGKVARTPGGYIRC